MIGFDLLQQMNAATWAQMCAVVSAGTLATGLMLPNNDNNITKDTIRKRTMFVRRYKEVNGRLMAVFTELIIPNHYGYGGWQAPDKALTPVGTTYKYLEDKMQWGFTEEKPAPKVLTFGSPDMMEEMNKVLEDG